MTLPPWVWETPDFVLLSETQTTAPVPSNPGFIPVVLGTHDTRFLLTPEIGRHTVYAWLKEDGIVRSTPAVDYIAYAYGAYCSDKLVTPFTNSDVANGFSWLVYGASDSLWSRGYDKTNNIPSFASDISNDKILVAWKRAETGFATDAYGSLFDVHMEQLAATKILKPTPKVVHIPGSLDIVKDIDIVVGPDGWLVCKMYSSDQPTIADKVTIERYDFDLGHLSSTQLTNVYHSGKVAIGCANNGDYTIVGLANPRDVIYTKLNNLNIVVEQGIVHSFPVASEYATFDLWIHRHNGDRVVAIANGTYQGATPGELLISYQATGTATSVASNVYSLNPQVSIHGRAGKNNVLICWKNTSEGISFCEYDSSLQPLYPVQSIADQIDLCAAYYLDDPVRDRYKILVAGTIKRDPANLTPKYADSGLKFWIYEGCLPPRLLSMYPSDENIGTYILNHPRGICPISPFEFLVIGHNAANIGASDLSKYETRIFAIDPTGGIVLKDRDTGSESTTVSSIVSVCFRCPPSTFFGCESPLDINFFMSESQTQPTDTDVRFAPLTSTLCHTFALSPNIGIHTVYGWFRNNTHVLGASDSIQVIDLSPSIFVKDKVLNDGVVTREHTVSVSFNPAGTSLAVTKWLLSESQTTKPLFSDINFRDISARFLPNTPNSFVFGSIPNTVIGEGQIRTIYAWMRDDVRVLHSTPATDSINLGFPPSGSLFLSDRTNGSGLTSLSRIVSVSINDNSNIRDGNVIGYLLSESQSTLPTYNNTRFVATKPVTISLSPGSGLKTVYLWLKNRYYVNSNAGPISHSITLQDQGDLTFTYIIRKGSNLISPEISSVPYVMRAGNFLIDGGDALLYIDTNGNPGIISGEAFKDSHPGESGFLAENWTDPSNIVLEGAIGYFVDAQTGLLRGQFRTISFSGVTWTD